MTEAIEKRNSCQSQTKRDAFIVISLSLAREVWMNLFGGQLAFLLFFCDLSLSLNWLYPQNLLQFVHISHVNTGATLLHPKNTVFEMQMPSLWTKFIGRTRTFYSFLPLSSLVHANRTWEWVDNVIGLHRRFTIFHNVSVAQINLWNAIHSLYSGRCVHCTHTFRHNRGAGHWLVVHTHTRTHVVDEIFLCLFRGSPNSCTPTPVHCMQWIELEFLIGVPWRILLLRLWLPLLLLPP